MTLLDYAFGILMTMTAPDLSIESTREEKRDRITLRFHLKNQGDAPVSVVLDDFFCEFHPRLFDAAGRELRAHDARALMGMRMEPNSVKATVIAPGKSADLGYVEVALERASASAHYLDWELQDLAGQKIQAEFGYQMLKERAARTEQRGAPGAITGRWTSARVEIELPPLTLKIVQAVLSQKKNVKHPDSVPLLIEALQKTKDEDARAQAAWSLGEMKAEAGVEALSAALRKDKSRAVRIYAADALGMIASEQGRSALAEAAEKDPDDLVRVRASDSLAKLREKRSP